MIAVVCKVKEICNGKWVEKYARVNHTEPSNYSTACFLRTQTRDVILRVMFEAWAPTISSDSICQRHICKKEKKLSLFWFGQTGKAGHGGAFLLHFDNSYSITQKKKKSRISRRMQKLNSLVRLWHNFKFDSLRHCLFIPELINTLDHGRYDHHT